MVCPHANEDFKSLKFDWLKMHCPNWLVKMLMSSSDWLVKMLMAIAAQL